MAGVSNGYHVNGGYMSTWRDDLYLNGSHQPPNPAASTDEGDFLPVLFKIVVPALFGLISVVGITGNALVVYVILSKRQMRTVTNLLLLNLALADLCFVVVIPPFTAYEYSTASWQLGRAACRLMHYLINVTAYVTVYTLVLVSAVRYMTVVHGVRTARLRTVTNVAAMIVSIWVIMVIVNGPIWTAYDISHRTDKCEPNPPHAGRYIFATFFTFGYVIPLVVIAVFSLCILRYITVHRAPVSTHAAAAAADRSTSSSAAKKRQAGRLLVLVVVVFAALWLPLNVHLLFYHFAGVSESRFYITLSVVWNCLAYANSCVNPFIYDHMSKDFRDAFREVMRCTGTVRAGSDRFDDVGNGHGLQQQQQQQRCHLQMIDRPSAEMENLQPAAAEAPKDAAANGGDGRASDVPDVDSSRTRVPNFKDFDVLKAPSPDQMEQKKFAFDQPDVQAAVDNSP